MIAHPNATWGITQGNPIWEEVREVARSAGPLFLLNVTLNRDRQITGVFAGDLEQAHAAGCAFVKQTAMVPVLARLRHRHHDQFRLSARPEPVPGGQGHERGEPDREAGRRDHHRRRVLRRPARARPVRRAAPQRVRPRRDCWTTICQPGFLKQDQWQAQIQAQIQLQADVYVRTDGLSRGEIEAALLKYSPRIEDTLAELLERYGPRATICVLPEGPQTIPYLGTQREKR